MYTAYHENLYGRWCIVSESYYAPHTNPSEFVTFDNLDMSTSANLPQAVQASLNQARANIPLAHRDVPEGVVSNPDSAFIHINDWAFLNGYAYVNTAASKKEGRYRYSCIFHSRKEGQRTRNYRKIDEKDRQRVNSYVRGMGCPVKITVSRYVYKSSLRRQI